MLDNLPRGTICIEDIEMGMTRHLRKVVTDEDIEMFAQVSKHEETKKKKKPER